MFAGLPGIGVGTLFYVLVALWMPVRELGRLLRGDVSVARWRVAIIQWCFGVSIIASVALADRILAAVLREGSIENITPARVVNETFAFHAPESLWAAPVAASLLLLVAVLCVGEAFRIGLLLAGRKKQAPRLLSGSPVTGDSEPAVNA